MNTIRKVWRKKIYNDIEKDRGKYFVTYCPINLKERTFAILELVFTETINAVEVAKLMEKEFDIWISKYPLPIMVVSYDEKEDKISLKNIKKRNELFGYIDKETGNIKKTWNKKTGDSLSKEKITDDYINNVYKDLSYKKREEKEKIRDEWLKEKRSVKKFFNYISFFWLALTILILFLGFQNYYVGIIAFIYSLYKTIRTFLKHKGFKTSREKKEQKKLNEMKHYYYHCKLNPNGFKRIVAENFEKENKKQI
jgi:hypothetical protein